MITSPIEVVQLFSGAIIIIAAIWKSASYIRSKANPINDARIKKILSNIHGQPKQLLLPTLPSLQYAHFPVNTDNKLPRPVTPIQEVEVDIPHSILQKIGKRTPTAIIKLPSKKSIGIFTSGPRIKSKYFKNHKSYSHYDFALRLNLSKFRDNPSLLPSENGPQKIQDLINQCEWLNAGPASKFEWRPYGMVIYNSCEKKPKCDHLCNFLLDGKTFYRAGNHRRISKMFYRSPPVTFEEAAEHLGMNHNETRAHFRKVMSNSYSECEGLSEISRNRNGKITEVKDQNPAMTERETGWVLYRDGVEFPDYRVRQDSETTYQAIIYPCSLNRDALPPEFEEFRISEPQFKVRNRWTEAVKDLFDNLAPRAEPIYGIPEDQWLPQDLT